MIRSIRWSLLTWYAVILVLVIGAFGAFVYHHRRRTVLESIDTELVAHARAVAGSIEWEEDEGFEFEQTERYAEHFAVGGADAPWFLVLHRDGRVLARSPDSPEPAGELPLGIRDEGDRRMDVVEGPEGTRVVVGMGTSGPREELAGFLATLVLAGGTVLLFSFLSGWFLVGRVLRPIRRMTETASRISGTDRSERIDVGRTESELGQLAVTLNEAFNRLQTALERQTRFTADASHELRTPLSVVVSNAELGLSTERSTEQYRELLTKCLRAARRMGGVVEGLLTLARSDAGELDIDGDPVDLRAVVTETVAFLEPLAEEHGVTVALHADAASLRGNANRLREAVGNLVSNAIRYNREGGSVEIELTSSDGRVELRVTDTGIGIPEEAQDHVFERFYRVDETRSREVAGSGLGLAITKWIVVAHGGTIELESEPGTGTTATVTIRCRDNSFDLRAQAPRT